MDAADAMYHLDAVAHSVQELVLPPDALNSQISGILRATRPFLDTDRDWILQNIELLRSQLSVYDALLNRIDDVRLEIQRRRDAVHRSMAAYSSTLAPIRRLPSEIFRAVFREVQISPRCNVGDESESKSESEDYAVLDFSQGPWKLSHVCGAWRDIVLSYPQLWSHIVLRYHWTSYPTETLHHTMSALQAMISRSAQHPLDNVFELDGNDKEDVAIEAFPVILEESYRWRSINLQISLPLLERLKVVRGKIPCLESLDMKTAPIPSHHLISSWHGMGTYGIQELLEEVQTVFIDAPRLRKVILYHTHGLGDFMFPPHITHLATRIGNLSSLEAYRSLVECRLFGKEEPGPDVLPPHPIHLPNLRRLYVSSVYLLAYLRPPSLDDLMISFVDNNSDIDVVNDVLVMNEFVHRSRCTLTSLAIHMFDAFEQVFVKDCLLLMDSLVSLEIRLFPYVDVKVIFNALASSKFLPNLQHLFLLVPCAAPSLWEPLTAMLSSRSQYLRSLRISCGEIDDVETVDEIDELLAPLRLLGLPMVVSMDNAISDFENFGSR